MCDRFLQEQQSVGDWSGKGCYGDSGDVAAGGDAMENVTPSLKHQPSPTCELRAQGTRSGGKRTEEEEEEEEEEEGEMRQEMPLLMATKWFVKVEVRTEQDAVFFCVLCANVYVSQSREMIAKS
ncbi:hypothetical protein E4U31_004435 [Claviceps sp. LM219 group G6]|nr:hypothetical protein E4U31_004435 [Claviceps sp. LM219 group G6]